MFLNNWIEVSNYAADKAYRLLTHCFKGRYESAGYTIWLLVFQDIYLFKSDNLKLSDTLCGSSVSCTGAGQKYFRWFLVMKYANKISDMKNKLVFILVLLILSLSGCGIISIGYNYAEVYLRYTINGYASFNDAQKVTIKTDVAVFMSWHRKKMLPEYAAFLQELQQVAQSGLPLRKEDIARFRIEVRALYVKTLLPATQPAASLLSSVDMEQVQELEKAFAKENKKQKDKELGGSQEEQLRKRAQRTIDLLETHVGSFNDNQLEKINELSHQLPFATAIYLDQRVDNQAKLIELLKKHAGETEIAAHLKTWLLSPEMGRPPAERSTMLAFENASDEMIVSVYKMLNDKQRKTLLKNIAKYIDTLQELASKN